MISLSWTAPSSTFLEFRLLRNRFGYPVDQDDGEVLLDSVPYPGSAWVDTGVIGGTYHYYGIYLLISEGSFTTWIRAGLAACLAPQDLGSGAWLLSRLPQHFVSIDTTELTASPSGNLFLASFLSVIGWALDYLQTQYNLTAQANNPQVIPLGALMSLAAELGFSFQPELPAGVMRKGVASAAQVTRERGTIQGIQDAAEILTGLSISPAVGYNMLLEDDQSYFPDPVAGYPAYNPAISYHVGERVTQGAWAYACLIAGTLNTPPPGTGTSSSNWSVILDADDVTDLANPVTGGISTWEARYPAAAGSVAPSGALREGIGVQDPANAGSFLHGSVRAYNTGGSAQTVEMCTVARLPSDIAALSLSPDPQQVILDGIPVPFIPPGDLWDATAAYQAYDVVAYNGQPFIALRGSTGSAPPSNSNVPTNEWAPLGLDSRIALMTSAWASQSIPASANSQAVITPYAVWYDQWGRYISKVSARSPFTQVANAAAATVAPLPAYTSTSTALTASAAGAFPLIDGVAVTAGQVVLVQSEASWIKNGLYALTTAGSVSAAWVLTRTSTPGTAYPGLVVQATAGTANGGVLFYCQNATAPTFGTTAITFAQTAPFYFQPANLYYDSFTGGWGSSIAGRTPDTGPAAWALEAGGMSVSSFASGTAIPSATSARSYALLSTASANCQVAATFVTGPLSGYSQGIVFRWADNLDYWRADQAGLYKIVLGGAASMATYPTVQPGDRLTVQANGSSIVVLHNGAQVANVTDSFNATATSHGIIYEVTTTTNFPVMLRPSSPARSRALRLRAFKGRWQFSPAPAYIAPSPPWVIRSRGLRPRLLPRLLLSRRRWYDPPWPQANQGQAFVPAQKRQQRRPVHPSKKRR